MLEPIQRLEEGFSPSLHIYDDSWQRFCAFYASWQSGESVWYKDTGLIWHFFFHLLLGVISAFPIGNLLRALLGVVLLVVLISALMALELVRYRQRILSLLPIPPALYGDKPRSIAWAVRNFPGGKLMLRNVRRFETRLQGLLVLIVGIGFMTAFVFIAWPDMAKAASFIIVGISVHMLSSFHKVKRDSRMEISRYALSAWNSLQQ